MTPTIINEENQITDDLLEYINNEAHKLSSKEQFEIDNYLDSEVLNPEIQGYLRDTYQGSSASYQMATLSLSFHENRLLLANDAAMGGWFGNLKETVRKIFCKIISAIDITGTIDWKQIIKAVLIGLIPVLGGGIYVTIITPFLIAFIAKLLKYGLDAVCPV
ncbi:MAG: hypothetical protein J0I09_09135 [Sphingobacteriia bacterium]|nr:hypothetical protein [Sphingobacteriia bacterium]